MMMNEWIDLFFSAEWTVSDTLFHGSGTGSTHPHFSHSTHALPVCCRWMIQTDHEWFPVMNGERVQSFMWKNMSNLAFVLSSIQYIYTSKEIISFSLACYKFAQNRDYWDNVIITLTLHFCITFMHLADAFMQSDLYCIENMHLICFRDLNLWSCHRLAPFFVVWATTRLY